MSLRTDNFCKFLTHSVPQMAMESKKSGEGGFEHFKSWKSEDPLMKYIHDNSLRLTIEQKGLLEVTIKLTLHKHEVKYTNMGLVFKDQFIIFYIHHFDMG